MSHLITVVVETSSHGYTNGNLEEEGRGPLKSMLSLLKGCVAFMRGVLSGLKKRAIPGWQRFSCRFCRLHDDIELSTRQCVSRDVESSRSVNNLVLER